MIGGNGGNVWPVICPEIVIVGCGRVHSENKKSRLCSTASVAGRFLNGVAGIVLIYRTITAGGLPSQHAVYDCRRTSNPRFDVNGFFRAVPRACTALDAGIPVANSGLLLGELKHRTRADHAAHSASRAFSGIKFERYNVFEVDRFPHHFTLQNYENLAIHHNTTPARTAAICSGTAHRISFFTPERDVKVEQPV